MPSQSQYFDGKISVPFGVFLEPDERKFTIRQPDGTALRTVEYNEIRKIRWIGGELHLDLNDPNPETASGYIVCKSKPDAIAIETYYKDHLPAFHSMLYALEKSSIFTKLALTCLTGVVIFYVLYLFFLNAYRWMPTKYDTYLGNKIHNQMTDAVSFCTNDSIQVFLEKAKDVLSSPADKFTPTFQVVDHPMVNAFAMPGGRIYLFKGLLEQSQTPEEILGILAHEMAHAEMRHGVQLMTRSIGFALLASMVVGIVVEGVELFESAEIVTELFSTLILLKYSRGFEADADQWAIRRLHQSKLTVSGMASFFKRLEKESSDSPDTSKTPDIRQSETAAKSKDKPANWFSSHPTHTHRHQTLSKAIKAENFPLHPNFETERAQWHAIKNSCPDTHTKVNWWKMVF